MIDVSTPINSDAPCEPLEACVKIVAEDAQPEDSSTFAPLTYQDILKSSMLSV